jgi:hypothetical protein
MTLLATSIVTAVVCGDQNVHMNFENMCLISQNECTVQSFVLGKKHHWKLSFNVRNVYFSTNEEKCVNTPEIILQHKKRPTSLQTSDLPHQVLIFLINGLEDVGP